MATDDMASELDRLEGLLKWWGAPAAGTEAFGQAHIQRFEAIVSELERAVAEISINQEQALTRSRELLVRSLPVFVNSHDLNEVMAMQSRILLSLFEAASSQVKSWMSFSDRIRNAQVSLTAEAAEAAPAHKPAAAARPRRRKIAP
jgi:hypothetical protein